MLNEWHLLAYVKAQLVAGVAEVVLRLDPDLARTGQRPDPDGPNAYGHAFDAEQRLYALGPDWPGAWGQFWRRERLDHDITRPFPGPTCGLGIFRIRPTIPICAPS